MNFATWEETNGRIERQDVRDICFNSIGLRLNCLPYIVLMKFDLRETQPLRLHEVLAMAELTPECTAAEAKDLPTVRRGASLHTGDFRSARIA